MTPSTSDNRRGPASGLPRCVVAAMYLRNYLVLTTSINALLRLCLCSAMMSLSLPDRSFDITNVLDDPNNEQWLGTLYATSHCTRAGSKSLGYGGKKFEISAEKVGRGPENGRKGAGVGEL